MRRGFVSLLLLFGLVQAGEAAQEDAADPLREAFETRFSALDVNLDSQLDATELGELPDEMIETLQQHGLPDEFPITREAFVAAGVASGAAMPEGDSSSDAESAEEKRDPSPDGAKVTTPSAGTSVVGVQRTIHRKSHFVPDLPAQFTTLDKNGDGQVALYEWDRKKYTEFRKLDLNGDGFLTPAELLPKGSLKSLYDRTLARSSTVSSLATATSGTPATATSGDETDREARNTFSQMDENKDGAVDEADWGRSRRIRPWFESAGIKVSLPLNVETFVSHYRRARESSGR